LSAGRREGAGQRGARSVSRRLVMVLVAVALSGCAGGGGEQRAPAKEKAAAAPANPNPPAAPPAASEPAPAAAAPQARAADAQPDWYLAAPVRGEGRLHASATAEAADLVEVRRSAVNAGTEALRKAHGSWEL